MTPDDIRAVAELLRAVAWPLVAVAAGIIFRGDLRDLARRLRKGGGAEFDSVHQASTSPATLESVESATSVTVARMPNSPRTVEWERSIRDHAPIETLTAAKDREDVLVRLLARAMLTLQFEQLESSVWASQLALLGYLNVNRQGAPPRVLQDMFYDPAAKAYPDWFKNYGFQQYLGFLIRNDVVNLDESHAIVRISQHGIEYLSWRTEHGRLAKVSG